MSPLIGASKPFGPVASAGATNYSSTLNSASNESDAFHGGDGSSTVHGLGGAGNESGTTVRGGGAGNQSGAVRGGAGDEESGAVQGGAIQATSFEEPALCVATRARFAVPYLTDPTVREVFAEVEGFVVAGLRGHGLDVTTPDWPACLDRAADSATSCVDRVLVIVGAYCYGPLASSFATPAALAAPTILLNLEVVGAASWGCFSGSQARRWSQVAVWDYSARNLDALFRASLLAPDGVNAAVVELGHYPGIVTGVDTRPGDPAAPPRDIPVLVVASRNERRSAVVAEIERRGVPVLWPAHTAGAEREALMRRARVLLNVHYFEQRLMEAVRLFHALSVGVAVVSEETPDRLATLSWNASVTIVPYARLADAVVRLATDEAAAVAHARAGYDLMRAVAPADRLRPALEVALHALGIAYAVTECAAGAGGSRHAPARTDAWLALRSSITPTVTPECAPAAVTTGPPAPVSDDTGGAASASAPPPSIDALARPNPRRGRL